jgi:hypothetical protein
MHERVELSGAGEAIEPGARRLPVTSLRSPKTVKRSHARTFAHSLPYIFRCVSCSRR